MVSSQPPEDTAATASDLSETDRASAEADAESAPGTTAPSAHASSEEGAEPKPDADDHPEGCDPAPDEACDSARDSAGTLGDVTVELSLVLGETTMPIHQLLRMGRGAVIALNTRNRDTFTLMANDIAIASSELRVDNGDISIAILELLPPRLPNLNGSLG